MAVDACCTVRKALLVGMENNQNCGEVDHQVSKHGLVTFKWPDNKPVVVLSNFRDTEMSCKQNPERWLKA